jgi:hypothetical protein
MRLTKAAKEQIVKDALTKTFAKRDEVLQQKRITLGRAVYDSEYKLFTKIMNALPDGYLSASSVIRAQFGKGCDGYIVLPLGEHRRVKNSSGSTLFGSEHHLVQSYKKITKLQDDIKADKKLLRSQLTSLLNSCTTTKKLLAAWPEAAEFLTDLDSSASQLPMVKVDDIRANMTQMKEAL